MARGPTVPGAGVRTTPLAVCIFSFNLSATLAGTKAASVTWTLTEHAARDKDTAWAVLTAVTLIREASYRFIERHPELKSKRDKNGTSLRKLVLAVPAPVLRIHARIVCRVFVATAARIGLTAPKSTLTLAPNAASHGATGTFTDRSRPSTV